MPNYFIIRLLVVNYFAQCIFFYCQFDFTREIHNKAVKITKLRVALSALVLNSQQIRG